MVDFGAPEREEGGLERTLTDHVLAVSDAIERVREETGRDVHLGGYSQGGMFCYQAAAYLRGEGIDTRDRLRQPGRHSRGAAARDPRGGRRGRRPACSPRSSGARAVPAWMSRTGFRLLDPAKSLRQRLDFLRQLHDREALLPRERQRRFLRGRAGSPGPARRWPTSCASSSPTTGCSRAAS